MTYVYEFLAANVIAIGCFIAGWIVGPRVITPLVTPLLAKIGIKIGG